MRVRALLILWAALWLSFSPAFAQTFPALSGRVVDQADLLSPAQEAELTQKLAALEAKNNRQFVVATLNSLEGYEIEDYGYRLGRQWAIGHKDQNDGLLLLVAPNERKVRIEVGYGLEGIVTDALSAVIIQTRILPRFRQGDMGSGIVAGSNALLDLLNLPDDQAEARAQQLVREARQGGGNSDIGSAIFWIIVIVVIIFIISRNNGGGGGGRRRSGLGPIVIWGPGGGDWGGGSGGGGFGGGFGGGGGSFGGGGASGGW